MNVKRTTAVVAATALVATPATFLVAGSAQAAEREVHGGVGGARYEISIEKEGNFEVSADLDSAPASSRWKLVVKRDGNRVGSDTARSYLDDGQHEVDFRDIHVRDSAGKDVFKVKIKRLDGAGQVTRTITMS